MPKKGSIINDIIIQDLLPNGMAIGQGMDTNGSFVAQFDARTVAPGDTISARILGKRNKQLQGRLETLDQPSTLRRIAQCEHFGICGGCGLQHIPYAEQVHLKEGIVRQCLENLVESADWLPTIACQNEFYFRNKMEFTASARPYLKDPQVIDSAGLGSIGLFVPYCGNKVLDIEHCHLQDRLGDQIRSWLRQRTQELGLSYYNSNIHSGWLRTVLIRNNLRGEFLVMLIVADDPNDIAPRVCRELSEAFKEISSAWYVINTKLNDSYADLQPVLAHGQSFITEEIGPWRYRVGPQTFLQVNSRQAAVLYDRIRELAQLSGNEVVYDLYCGVGTISLWLAPYAQRIVGIEYVEPAVVAAKQAAEENQQSNVSFFAGDMKDLLVSGFFELHGQPDVVITDPPRAGMHPKALATLAASGAKRIVYVSCNPQSLARDLPPLMANYQIKTIQAIDLMPQSHHIETLLMMELR